LGTGVDAATKFAQDDGKFSDYIDVENLDVRDRALDKAFRLHGAYAPKDPKEAAQFGVKVVIIDVPRPQHGVWMPDVGPGAIVQWVFSVVNGSQTIGTFVPGNNINGEYGGSTAGDPFGSTFGVGSWSGPVVGSSNARTEFRRPHAVRGRASVCDAETSGLS
jgi:hypothetical protein